CDQDTFCLSGFGNQAHSSNWKAGFTHSLRYVYLIRGANRDRNVSHIAAGRAVNHVGPIFSQPLCKNCCFFRAESALCPLISRNAYDDREASVHLANPPYNSSNKTSAILQRTAIIIAPLIAEW